MNKISVARTLLLASFFFTFGVSGPASAETLRASVNTNKTQQFLSLADIHFDPFIFCSEKPCPLIQKLRATPAEEWSEIFASSGSSEISYGKDSSFTLLESSLAAAKKEAKTARVQFVLMLGDFLAHDYDTKYRKYSGDKTKTGYAAFVKKTMEFLGAELNQAFPQTDIYWVVGNNDSYETDYSMEPKGLFFKDLSKMEASLVKNKKNKQQILQDLPRGGYYAVTAPNQPGLRLIFLNSVLFSRKAKGPELKQAAEDQLSWLHKELSLAGQKKQKILIAMHIPIGVDVYTTLFVPFTIVEFWKAPYSQRFLDEIQQTPAQIMGVFTAHIHADTFQILASPHHKPIPFTGTPAISPVFGNNPGFKIYSYSAPGLQLVDFSTYYYSIKNKNNWEKEYDFDEVYQLNHSSGEMVNGMLQLQPKGELAERYKTYYAVNSNSQPITKYNKWLPYYWCAIHGLTSSDYQNCLSTIGA